MMLHTASLTVSTAFRATLFMRSSYQTQASKSTDRPITTPTPKQNVQKTAQASQYCRGVTSHAPYT
jgi:hypothetical protein